MPVCHQTPKVLTYAFWLLLSLSSSSCLEPQSPAKKNQIPENPELGPQIPLEETAAALRLSLKGLSLTGVLADATEMRVEVFEVVDNKRASAKGPIQVFALQGEGSYKLADLPPGLYDIAAELFDNRAQVLAKSELRVLLAKGEQTLGELAWRKVEEASGEQLAQLRFDLVFDSPTEPAEVRQIIKSSCLVCHSASKKRGGLNLELFPYQSDIQGTAALGSAGIALLNVERIRDTLAPMPPPPLRPLTEEKRAPLEQFAKRLQQVEEQIQQAEQWLGQGELTIRLAEGTEVRSQLLRQGTSYVLEPVLTLKTGQSYSYSLSLRRIDGSLLYEAKERSFQLTSDGKFIDKIPVALP